MKYVIVITGGTCEAADDDRPCVLAVIGFESREEASDFMQRMPKAAGEVPHFMHIQKPSDWLQDS